MPVETVEKITPEFIQKAIVNAWGVPGTSYKQTFESADAAHQAAFLAAEKYFLQLNENCGGFDPKELYLQIAIFIDGYLAANGIE